MWGPVWIYVESSPCPQAKRSCFRKFHLMPVSEAHIDTSHFITEENIERLKQARDANRVQLDYTQLASKDESQDGAATDGVNKTGTVGCVAVDKHGNLAIATSTGGFMSRAEYCYETDAHARTSNSCVTLLSL